MWADVRIEDIKNKVTYYRKANNYYGIYDLMMNITDNDHEISSDAASWCELASIGEVYEFREGTLEIEMDYEDECRARDNLM